MSPRLLAFFLLLPALAAQGAEVGAGGTAPTASVASSGAAAQPLELGASALQMVLGLLVVLGLLLGALWLLKRIGQPQGPAAGLMRVVAGVAVGARERVVILELGNSWLVLGVAPGQVNTLAEIPRQEVPTSAASAAMKDFPSWLRQVMKNRGHA